MEKRNTIQKQLVLDAVYALGNHPTAEAVYAQVACKHPSVSKATVYRNLSSLAEDGLLRHIEIPGSADRFDHTLSEHHHIQCTACGCFGDAPVQNPEALDRFVEQKTGYTQVEHDVVFHGLCPGCAAGCKNKLREPNVEH